MTQITQTRCLPFLAMLNLIFCLCIRLFGTYPVTNFLHEILTLATLLFFPMWCVLNDVTAEIYGYKIARNLLISSFLCLLVFSLFSYLSVMVINIHSNIIFLHVFDNFTSHVLYSFLVFTIAWKINVFLLLKWKKILNSKYFILRSIGSSSVGIVVSVTLLDLYYGIGNSNHHISNFLFYVFVTTLARITLTSLLTFPAYLVISIIRVVDANYLGTVEPVVDNPFLKKENIINQDNRKHAT